MLEGRFWAFAAITPDDFLVDSRKWLASCEKVSRLRVFPFFGFEWL
jgi:hypothetical protein